MTTKASARRRPAPREPPATRPNGKPPVATPADPNPAATTLNLLICVGGIYASFLTWGVLQERIATTDHGTGARREVFTYPVVTNTVQSACAAALGYGYVVAMRRRAAAAAGTEELRVFPSRGIVGPLGLVAVVSSLASPVGYASLRHVDYVTFILAKSCKLLPVMVLHVTVYGKRFPFYKYAVVALVTAGVAIFTLHQSSAAKKKKGPEGSSLYGLLLLAINLLFDGLTNSTQDDIYAKFRPYSGPQMMCALNTMSTVLTSCYLLLSPYLLQSGLGAYVGMDGQSAGELRDGLAFLQRHPGVGWDILGFAICGAVGQVFIFMTLSIFGSLLLVTVTVTRKMLTMIISVLWFGHRLTGMQWVGVALVFGGIGVEAELSKREKRLKEEARRGEKKA